MSDAQPLESCRTFGDYTLDCADERLIGPRGPVKIGNKAFQVLSRLVDQEGRLLTKDALFTSVWDGMAVSESSLTSVIKELRRALGDESRTPRYIESVYGRGYRLIPPVTVREQQDIEPATKSAKTPRAGRSEDRGKPPLVLVAPFNDEAVRDSHPYCASALREEVLSGLARVREIRLIADDGERPARAGERGYHLSATLLPDDSSVKVIARAKRLGDARIVWAETMRLAGAGGIAQGVERIVRRIIGAALPALDEDFSLGLPPEPGDLYDAYLVAKRLSFIADDFPQAESARDMLERIIAERPDFGLAYPPLVRLYHTDFNWTAFGATGAGQRAAALALAKSGLAADRGNAHAHSVLGWCYIWHNERVLARRSFEQALALNPYNRVRVQEAATAWTYLGDFDGAQAFLDRALELDPLPDDDFCEDRGRLKLACGDYAEARESLGQLARGSIWADLYLGACETALGSPDGATRMEAWLARVTQGWHGGRRPSRAEIIAWVRLHHPLPPEAADCFFKPIERALMEIGEPGGERASAAPRRNK